jgi:hypothetical protein
MRSRTGPRPYRRDSYYNTNKEVKQEKYARKRKYSTGGEPVGRGLCHILVDNLPAHRLYWVYPII